MNAQDVLRLAIKVKSQMDEDILELNEVLIPDSWIDDNGIRHAVVYGGDFLAERLLLEKVGDSYAVREFYF